MLHFTLLRCATKKKVFELFCREQLLSNYALRELPPAERRVTMAKDFKELSMEALSDLKQRASIEESRLEALQRAAAKFKPLTPYEFFVKEQQHNPALGSSTNPRDREVRLLQIYKTLPDNAKEALAARAERYNAEHSKVPVAPALPVVAVIRKKELPTKLTKNAKKSKKKKKKPKTGPKPDAAAGQRDKAVDKKKKTLKRRGALSPYSIFVKEQMASLHHLAPKERMRVVGERWRSLTKEERERRLEAARAKIAAEAATAQPAADGHARAAKEEAISGASSAASPASGSPSPASQGEARGDNSVQTRPSWSSGSSSPACAETKADAASSPSPTTSGPTMSSKLSA